MDIKLKYTEEHYNHYKNNGDKNYFEELVDKVVLDATNIEDSYKEIILSLPREKKRMALLSVIDERSLFLNIKANLNPVIGRMEHIQDVVLMLRKYVKNAEVEKKKFGEVMTPLDLVKRILSKLPEDVWSNPYLKWLDPANGTGPFPSIVIYKLMKGLESWESDEEKRYRHIVENMIYVAEIQPKNMFLYMCAFDPFDVYKLNVYTGSFLDEGFDYHMKNVWNVESFDIVIGNPPYNQMIDMSFIRKSYSISDKVIFIHPSTWLIDEKNKQRKFIETKDLIKNHLECIELFNGNKIFGIQLFVPCVITYINKSKKSNMIECLDEINDVKLLYDDIYKINKFSNVVQYQNIKRKIKEKKFDNIDNHKIFNISTPRNSKKNKIEKYKHLNTTGEYYINIAQIRGHVDLNSDKNMLLDDFYTIVTRDNKVEREISNHMFFKFETEIESNNFLGYLKTDFARFCLAMNKNNSQLECGELSGIPWLDFSKKWNDDDLYDLFELDKDEINFIKEFIPKYY